MLVTVVLNRSRIWQQLAAVEGILEFVLHCQYLQKVFVAHLLTAAQLGAHCYFRAQSINLWSQKTPLLGKHVQTNTRPTIQELGSNQRTNGLAG
jgi:hypothetical protein